MFMESTRQFQQATQSTLQANSQAIAKLRMQMGQLATLINEEEEESPNQSIVNLEDQFEIEASSHFEQAEIITLRNDIVIDDQVGEPEVVNVQKDEDETQSNIENISMSLEPSTSTPVRNESIIVYMPDRKSVV